MHDRFHVLNEWGLFCRRNMTQGMAEKAYKWYCESLRKVKRAGVETNYVEMTFGEFLWRRDITIL